ncbi:MAG: DNA-protecting protein DprA [Chloroflexota bacterium]|nr:DNA-protecting protein DprA [Chloroflexota bacterium]
MRYEQIAPADSKYPASVARSIATPATLYVLGRLDLLSQPTISICGSRAASESALRYSEQFGAIAAQVGFVVVSGNAKGVDRAAHRGALEAGGATVVVSPEGIDQFRVAREFRDLADLNKNFAVVSQFEPNAGWTAYRAMQRNKYIVALSRGLFVIEAREKGGTLDAGLEGLRQKKPLWVMEYAKREHGRAGNRILLEKGGTPVRTTGELKDILTTAYERRTETSVQTALAF